MERDRAEVAAHDLPPVFAEAALACRRLSDHLYNKNGSRPVLLFENDRLTVDERIPIGELVLKPLATTTAPTRDLADPDDQC